MLRRTDVRVLLAAAVWTLYVWGNRVVNLVRNDDDRSAAFIVVHVVLAVVSVAFAVAIGRIALRARRDLRSGSATPSTEARSAQPV